MYENVGGKIKVVAMVFGWIGLIGGGLTGLIMMLANEELLLVGGIVLAWGLLSFVLSWPLYGFGELVEDTGILRKKVEQMTAGANSQPSSAPSEQPVSDELPDL